MTDIIEIDAATGNVINRSFTPEELAQREKDAADYAAAVTAAEAATVEREQQRSKLLERLGLTSDEFNILVGGMQ